MGLTEQAIGKIREQISTGMLGPGDRLPPEQELARKLTVSRSSLREAVSALVHARVLDVRRGDGTYVTSLEPTLLLEGLGLAVDLMQDERLGEVMEARRMLEPLMAGLAAERINSRVLDQLRGHLGEMRAAVGDATALVAHDVAFHDSLVDAAGNSTLASVLKGFSTTTIRGRTWRALVEAEAADEAVAQHSHILSAVATGDVRLAEAYALLHVATSEAWLRGHLLGANRNSDANG